MSDLMFPKPVRQKKTKKKPKRELMDGLMFPKYVKKKKRKKHKKSIIQTEKRQCFLCKYLYGDTRYQYTEEHHVMYGNGQREVSEEEGIKVDLCLKHHKEGPEAVHSNREMRELLCRIFQEEYEKTHTRKEWRSNFRKNYLEADDEDI